MSVLGKETQEVATKMLQLQEVVSSPSVTLPDAQPQPLLGILPLNQGHPVIPFLQGNDKPDDPSNRWVKNLSKIPLTPAQRSLLSKGPSYAIAPGHPLNLEYITAIESACQKLNQKDGVELRADINRVLRGSHPQANLSKAEQQAIQVLKGILSG